MHQIGSLGFEVERAGLGLRLVVQLVTMRGGPQVQSDVTEAELRSLAAYLLRAAEAAKEEGK